ncbi:MAG: metal ABC transporter permease, partial [Betaproteobacteria bacterium]
MTQELLVFWPALAAGVIVAATHVPLGVQVLARGIVFIDLAVAQMAGLGVVLAGWLGMEASGAGMQLTALGAALAGALFFTWTETRWPQVQEAVIGVVFILAANAAILLLAANPHGAEHLKDLLTGQILWVTPAQAGSAALASLFLMALWKKFRQSRIGFYVLFACAVTVSVQLVGMYL